MGDLILFEALTGGASDRLNWQHSGEFDQNFSEKSNAKCPRAVLELTGTLGREAAERATKSREVDLRPVGTE